MAKSSGVILFYVTAIMSMFYPIIGLYLVFSSYAASILPGSKHVVLGILLIGYGFFRFFRVKQLRNQMKKSLEE